jgi:hypothetical protein
LPLVVLAGWTGGSAAGAAQANGPNVSHATAQ